MNSKAVGVEPGFLVVSRVGPAALGDIDRGDNRGRASSERCPLLRCPAPPPGPADGQRRRLPRLDGRAGLG